MSKNINTNSITFINEDGTVTANKKKLGKLLRTFRDDCTEFADLNLATTTIEHADGVGQLFIAFIELAEDVKHLTVKTSERSSDFTDKQLGTLLLNFRDYVIAADIGDMSKATKLDDKMFGAEFISYFNHQAVCPMTVAAVIAEEDQIEGSLIVALTKLGFKDIRKTSRGNITTEDRPGVTPKQLRDDIANVSPVFVQSVNRSGGRIGYYNLLLTEPAEVKPNSIANRFDLLHSITEMANNGNEAAVEILDYIAAKEQKKHSKAVIHIGGSDASEVISYTKKDLGYFFWTLLDDLYMAKGMDFIKEVIGDGGNELSKKNQKILANRFLHAFSFEGSN